MEKRTRSYAGEALEVTYDLKRCIHAAECVRGLPAVFDSQRRPWVQPDAADADAVARTIERCPSGALHYARHDGGANEAPAAEASIVPQLDGPLYLRGDIALRAPDGTLLAHETRVALCRCGQSANKPFCDGSHHQAAFHDPGAIGEKTLRPAEPGVPATLVVTPTENGPIEVLGAFSICDASGETCKDGGRAYLCRCGASANKPFCDGTHSKIGFRG
ncbi:CDGSH iron-sulfur domain-containing protein [Kouleothrix sp.]|uniref:CDGSH iron-sulfur domain-containing protein n=1 Tax=Kouleothrix sp. TaxID=2779161 RepID=UPI00391ADB86